MCIEMPRTRPKLKFQYLDPESIIASPDFRIVESFLKITGRTEIGWHYIIDLTWIYSQAKHWPLGLRILDAGGGSGPTQFLLSEMGMDVVNVDLFQPMTLNYNASRYGLAVKRLDSYEETDYVVHLSSIALKRRSLSRLWQSLVNFPFVRHFRQCQYQHRHDNWRRLAGFSSRPVGRLTRLAGNLCFMPEIHDGSFDAVVSLSALEHVPMAKLPDALKEIDRVLKPDAYRAITTSATDKPTWFHEPSRGVCFSRSDLEKLFGAEPIGPSDPAVILGKYRTAFYLRDHLAGFYKNSGDNGMPWGIWDPKYLPVGVMG
jgi:SAM-dependent methyltransferase